MVHRYTDKEAEEVQAVAACSDLMCKRWWRHALKIFLLEKAARGWGMGDCLTAPRHFSGALP